MEGTPSPSYGIVKVERSFEWSRLESELMTSAYEHVVPMGRSTQSTTVFAEREHGYNAFDIPDGARSRYATGA